MCCQVRHLKDKSGSEHVCRHRCPQQPAHIFLERSMFPKAAGAARLPVRRAASLQESPVSLKPDTPAAPLRVPAAPPDTAGLLG